jgi:AmmeMemoRadiSam system protein B
MEKIRPPAVAGSFYPADAGELSALLDDCFLTSPLGPQGTKAPMPSLIGGMVPHAGFIYSGPCAAHLYACLDTSVNQVVLLGVNHSGRGHKAALSPWDAWLTPLGRVPVDGAISEALAAQIHFLKQDALPHRQEHSIEVQLPLLQRVLGNFRFVPISISYLSKDECAELGAAIAALCQSDASSPIKTIILASSDLNHYLSAKETDELDRKAVTQVLALNPRGLIDAVERENISMCGVLPTAVMLFAANYLGAKQARLLKHCHSGDVSPMRKVVGYASVALTR